MFSPPSLADPTQAFVASEFDGGATLSSPSQSPDSQSLSKEHDPESNMIWATGGKDPGRYFYYEVPTTDLEGPAKELRDEYDAKLAELEEQLDDQIEEYKEMREGFRERIGELERDNDKEIEFSRERLERAETRAERAKGQSQKGRKDQLEAKRNEFCVQDDIPYDIAEKPLYGINGVQFELYRTLLELGTKRETAKELWRQRLKCESCAKRERFLNSAEHNNRKLELRVEKMRTNLEIKERTIKRLEALIAKQKELLDNQGPKDLDTQLWETDVNMNDIAND